MEADIVVIGGGAGGLAAAREGARRGAEVVLVERERLGGECTFTGCVPSKTLIARGKAGDDFATAMTAVRDTVELIASTENAGVLEREGIRVVTGVARFTSPGRLSVDGTPLKSARIVIGTGARPRVLPIVREAGAPFLTNETVFDMKQVPRTLVVLGGGAVGCELAQAFRRFGCSVVLVESGRRLLDHEEPAASEVVASVFVREGIDVLLGVEATAVQLDDSGKTVVQLDDGRNVTGDALLVAVGREPSTESLGLGAIDIDLGSDGSIVTDEHLATTAPGVWAVGDVTARLPFTHAADEMGRIAAANAFSKMRKRKFDASRIPWVTFTEPEVARIGMSEAQAAEHDGRVAHLPLDALDRAITDGRTDGFIRLIAGPRRVIGNAGGGRLLGATIVAPRAGELIHEAALVMRTGAFVGRLAQTVRAYPTWSVGVRQAAAMFFMDVNGQSARDASTDA